MTPELPPDAPGLAAGLSDDELAALAWRATQALPDAPPALRRAAIGLWPAAVAPRAAPTPPADAAGRGVQGGLAGSFAAGLHQVLAVLRFDSAAMPALASGMRGAAHETRHLLYSAAGRDVDLRITPQGAGQWRLSGQVLGPDESGQVLLSCAEGDAGAAGAAAQQQAALDEMGEFHLPAVASGAWTLRLALGDECIELPLLTLGPGPGPG